MSYIVRDQNVAWVWDQKELSQEWDLTVAWVWDQNLSSQESDLSVSLVWVQTVSSQESDMSVLLVEAQTGPLAFQIGHTTHLFPLDKAIPNQMLAVSHHRIKETNSDWYNRRLASSSSPLHSCVLSLHVPLPLYHFPSHATPFPLPSLTTPLPVSLPFTCHSFSFAFINHSPSCITSLHMPLLFLCFINHSPSCITSLRVLTILSS